MSLSKGETSIDSPFESAESGGDPTTEAAETEGEWWGLRNTQPPITPAEIGSELDIEAEWWQHLGCGYIKQSSSTGAEAWMHYLMALMLLISHFADAPTPGGSKSESEDDDSGTNGGPETVGVDDVFG